MGYVSGAKVELLGLTILSVIDAGRIQRVKTNNMNYKVTIIVEREDEIEIKREFLNNPNVDYNEAVESIISSLEAEI